jgi:4-hydroxyphenylacetate 3-monooxygenase
VSQLGVQRNNTAPPVRERRADTSFRRRAELAELAPYTRALSVEGHITTLIRSGAEYKEALRDGREVWYRGERIEDVVTHPATSGLVELIAKLYDDQSRPETEDVLTYVHDGTRLPTSWLAPTTPEDLVRRRACCEHFAWETWGTVGRAPDMITWTQIGLLAHLPTFRRLSPEYADNLAAYHESAQVRNVLLAAVIAEPQGIRSRSGRAGDDRDAVFRVTEQTPKGLRLSGARTAGSIAAQADELLVSTIFTTRPEESVWAAIPIASPGLKFLCRETTARPDASSFDHPIASHGDELDCLVILDDVFVPHERVFCYGAPELQAQGLYGHISAGEHWNVLDRLCVKAEIFAGAAQLVVEALEVEKTPAARDAVARIAGYAQVLRAGVLAAEQLAAPTEGGILMPDLNMIAAVRAYALDNYPEVVHILQELCGQGLVMRFSEVDFDHPELGPRLETFLAQPGISAREKNRLMNLVWDLTTDSHAGRSTLFENVNATPSFILRQKLYAELDRSAFIDRISRAIGLQREV